MKKDLLLSMAAITMNAVLQKDSPFMEDTKIRYLKSNEELKEIGRQLNKGKIALEQEFNVKGHKIMAKSKKDAIQKLKHRGLI